ncbi:MAG TPA: TIGR00730 family Rossman fold protein [Bordetella sp.]
MSELQTAADQLAEIGPAVSLFGSARIPPDSPYYAKTLAIAAALAKAGFAVIAGGGPGIMEAANKGAFEAGGCSVGLNIKLPHETTDNVYQTHSLHFHYFTARKTTFFMHSMAYVALPGGFGTLDELFEALTLLQTNKLPATPIILVGGEFWGGLIDWMRGHMLSAGMISPADLSLFTIEDDPDRIVGQLVSFYGQYLEAAGKKPPSLPTTLG